MIEKKYQSIFDVPVKSVDGQENFLKQFKGKILFFVNTTGKCGNSQQWPIIENILKEYKEQGVEVIYTPTNDYCGSVTFDDYVYGVSKGSLSAEYAHKTFGVEAYFTDLVSSRNEIWKPKNLSYDFENNKFGNEVALPDMPMEQQPRDPLYQFLIPDDNKEIMCGNFHKFITNRKGQPVAIFHNGTLLNAVHNSGYTYVGTREEEEQYLKDVLDEVIRTDSCVNPRYAYDPYNNIEPEWVKQIR